MWCVRPLLDPWILLTTGWVSSQVHVSLDSAGKGHQFSARRTLQEGASHSRGAAGTYIIYSRHPSLRLPGLLESRPIRPLTSKQPDEGDRAFFLPKSRDQAASNYSTLAMREGAGDVVMASRSQPAVHHAEDGKRRGAPVMRKHQNPLFYTPATGGAP
ncbi:hypothetical protein VUR80DRAFT_7161 [Thermomyces stellatus]